MDHFFKVFIEFVTILLLFYVLIFGLEAYGILAPQPGIEPSHPALEGEILTTGPLGKAQGCSHLKSCLGPENLLPKWLTSHGCRQEVSVPHEADLSICCLSVLTTWQLASPRVSDPRQRTGKRCCAFYNLVTHHNFCHILFIILESLSPAHA